MAGDQEVTQAQAAERIRALRGTGMSDDEIRAMLPESYTPGWDIVDLEVEEVPRAAGAPVLASGVVPL